VAEKSKRVKMAAVGKDCYFHSPSPYAQVSAVDFRVVGILASLEISVLKGRFNV